MQVLQDHLETKAFAVAIGCSSSPGVSIAEITDDDSGGSGKELGDWRRRHESNNSDGTSKMERCRFSSFRCGCFLSAAAAAVLVEEAASFDIAANAVSSS